MSARTSLKSKLIAGIGIAWITWLLGRAIVRLTPLALEPWLDHTLTTPLKFLWVAWFVVNGYFEGYRGFQQRFSPRVVARAAYLGEHPTPLRVLLALPFCLSLFHARRGQLIFRWTFISVLSAVIYLVKFVPQPWRGILDGGVVVGLSWGLGAVWYYFALYLADRGAPPPTDLPEPEPQAIAAGALS